MKYPLRGMTYMYPISEFFIQYMTGHVRTEESDSYVHGINRLGQNAEWHVRNIWLTEIWTTSLAVAILHFSALCGHEMRSS